MLPLPAAAERARAAIDAGGRVALLFGSEKTGLSNHDFSHCHGVVGIPARAEHASMNLGQAAAVCLYALSQAGVEQGELRELPLAEAEHVDRITALLGESLAAVNYTGIGRAWADDNLRALVRRMRIPQQDASALTGMLRKVLWVLQNKK
jgi:tRNA/rRNA methyltransferase